MNSVKQNKRNISIIYLILFGLITVILWQFQIGRLILYPFTILGTWFHEMAHGMTALVLGGSFIRLDIFSDGSGVAIHSGNLFFGNLGSALTAGAGPMGPTIAGFIFLVSSTNRKFSRVLLFLLSIFMLLSCLFWVRSWIGLGIIIFFSILIFYTALKGSDRFQKLSLQFLGVQAFASLYLSINYLFSSSAVINGQSYSSDTQVIAQNLLLPYWFWGGFILSFSVVLIVISIIKIK